MRTNGTYELQEALEPSDQGWILTSAGYLAEKDSLGDSKTYQDNFNQAEKENSWTLYELFSYNNNVEEIFVLNFENEITYCGDEYEYEADCVAYVSDSKTDEIPFDIMDAHWDTRPERRMKVTRAATSDVKNYFSRAENRKL